MSLSGKVHGLDLRISFKLLLFLWVFTRYNEVDGVPTRETVTKARCYANCLTKNPATNQQEQPCQTPACNDCSKPCGNSFPDETTCKQSCKNAGSCLESCEFLTRVKNFSSIFTGDGSISPTPGIPAVTNTTLTSISLQWEPVKNTSGSPVYMVEMAFGSFSEYLSEVFIEPEATVTLQQLCAYIRSPPFRSDYSPILYKFKVAVLTENASLSYGQQSMQTTLKKPNPVKNVTLDSLVYDASSKVDKVKLTVSWIPSKEQKQLITKFAMAWEVGSICKGPYFLRTKETPRADSIFSMQIYQELTKCVHTVRIYSMIDCSASDAATLQYTYPGCQNITNFPESLCYKFDPPEAPIEDRVARNIRLEGPLTAQEDYRFQGTVVWDSPLYPYKDVYQYLIRIFKENRDAPTGFEYLKFGTVKVASYFLTNLLPGTKYKVEVRAYFMDNRPLSGVSYTNFTTPGVVSNEVEVRNLTAGQFYPSPGGGSFVLNISWLKPTFNYSTLSLYQLSYQAGNKNNTEHLTNTTHFVVSRILHGERVDYRVTPIYKHEWIKGVEVRGNSKAPVPPEDDVRVKSVRVVGGFLAEQGNRTFSVNFSWTGPAFNFTFRSYDIAYELTGYNADNSLVHRNVRKPEFYLSRIRPKEIVTLKVTPVFDNKYIPKVETSRMATAPEPDPRTVKIRNITYRQLNTSTLDQFDVLISWQRPIFNESSIGKYTITYRRSGNPDRAKLWQFKTADTSFPVYDMIPGDKMEAEVTPEFVASVITGVTTKISIETPEPNHHEIQVRNFRSGVFVEDEESNTFSVNFTWQTPSFKHSKVHSYTVSYEFYGGYQRKKLACNPLARDRTGCSKTGLNKTSLQISGILPREGVSVKVTPIYSNKHIAGQVVESRVTAPEPKEELVKVIGLQYDELVPGPNNTFGTTMSWQKPLFTHSGVKHYRYKVLRRSAQLRRKRDTNQNTALETSGTNVTISGINRDDAVEFQVTPVFEVSAVTGKNEKIMLTWKKENEQDAFAKPLSPVEIGGLVVGVMFAVLLAFFLMLLYYRERRKQLNKRGLVSGKNALMIDQWEVDGDLVSLDEELGEGAFGKVYKGVLKELTTPTRKLSVMPPINALRKTTIKQNTAFTVAVKMLHGMADSDQRREFLEEIQLMKAVGSHKNIVNMIGCCTVEEPMFLLVEYVPYGDLLHYLRKRRGKVREYLGDESKGPYRSTYCETYVIDSKPGGIAIQATRSDRIYVNTPDAQKGDSGNVQILSLTQSPKTEEDIGSENKGMNNDEPIDEDEESEDGLTPGDLLAFAWQISEGMEYLARKGFVHRDLAARNVLVGEHKIAKVADFGLTRHVYEEKVYHGKRNRKLPLKWMSIEAIFDQTFTTQSDVWAFGVLLWELVTLGGTPYPTINNRELLRLLQGGYRMEKPDICNDEMYKMMTECWMEAPEERPNFTQIRERLEEMMQKDNPYLDFSVLDESRDYYNVPSFNSLGDETTDDELLDKEEDELLQEPSDNVNAEENKPNEDSNRSDLATMSEAFKSLDKKGSTFESNDVDTFEFHNNNFSGKDFRDLKEVKVDFDAIEMSLYRPGSRGIVL